MEPHYATLIDTSDDLLKAIRAILTAQPFQMTEKAAELERQAARHQEALHTVCRAMSKRPDGSN